MPVYIALLRGVNVGNNILKMDRLRQICADLKFQNPQTYVQSGNIVFRSNASAEKLTKALEIKLAGETRLPVTVALRTADQLNAILAANPFLKRKGVDLKRLHVTFLCAPVAADVLKNLSPPVSASDEFRVLGDEIYLHCPGGYGQTKLSTNVFERLLKTKATTRNWNTVGKLAEMAAACE